jgi:hypothetical protein
MLRRRRRASAQTARCARRRRRARQQTRAECAHHSIPALESVASGAYRRQRRSRRACCCARSPQLPCIVRAGAQRDTCVLAPLLCAARRHQPAVSQPFFRRGACASHACDAPRHGWRLRRGRYALCMLAQRPARARAALTLAAPAGSLLPARRHRRDGVFCRDGSRPSPDASV